MLITAHSNLSESCIESRMNQIVLNMNEIGTKKS